MATKTRVDPKKLEVGKRIAGARKAQGFTQLELAHKLSVTSGAISQYETGRALPERELFRLMSIVLEKSEEWLLTGNDPNGLRTAQTTVEERILRGARNLTPEDQDRIASIIEAWQEKPGTRIKPE